MNIGQLSQRSGVSAKMIRHYESIGLIPPAERNAAGYRLYQEADVQSLNFIRRARHLGFGLSDIQRLLELWLNPQRPSADVKALAQHHIRQLEQNLESIQDMLGVLQKLADGCQGNQAPDCPILAELAAETTL